MATHASRLSRAVTAPHKSGTPSLKWRLQRCRKLKLRLETLLDKNKEIKQELKIELRDRDAYIRQLEALVERHQRQIDQCTARLPKGGRIPIARCFDCGDPFPVTHFQLRVASNGKAKNWVINGLCKRCRGERGKKVDAKRREIGSAKRMDDDQQIKAMAGELAGRISDRMIDDVVDGRSSNRGGRVIRGNVDDENPSLAERY